MNITIKGQIIEIEAYEKNGILYTNARINGELYGTSGDLKDRDCKYHIIKTWRNLERRMNQDSPSHETETEKE